MPARNSEALAFLAARRSRPAKQFTAPVPTRAQVEEMLAIATRVPDHGKLEPWRLVVVDRAAMAGLADLAEEIATARGWDAERIAKGRGQYDLGQLAVVVISAPRDAPKVPLIEQQLSAGALCMALVTTAEAAGWGACWLTGWPAHEPEFAARAFGCTGQERIIGIVHIATPGGDGADRPRPDLGRLVEWRVSGA